MVQSTLVGSGKRRRGSAEDTEMNVEDSGSLKVSLRRIHRVDTTTVLRGLLEDYPTGIDSGIGSTNWGIVLCSALSHQHRLTAPPQVEAAPPSITTFSKTS